ncbi:MAG: phosphatidylglycerol lysyltransferase domain-containing protein [Clostridia bacterium]
MNNGKNDNIRKYLENIAIVLIVFSGIANIILSMPYAPIFFQNIGRYYTSLNHSNIEVYGLLRRIIGFILLFVAHGLYKRMRLAWLIAIISISVSVSLHFIRLNNFINPMVFGEILIIATLIFCQSNFRRKSDAVSVKKALLLASGSILLVLTNSAVGFLSIKEHYSGIKDFAGSFVHSVKILFFIDTTAVATSRIGVIYTDMTIIFNWLFIIFALFYVLRPIIYNPIITKYDKDRVFKLVSKHGQNPMAYLALENDKKYFFSDKATGVIAFAVVADVAVVCGDIICTAEDAPIFLAEFMGFCKENNYAIMLINITNKFLELYQAMGFDYTKYGEDACFLLADYNLIGGKVAKVRAAINHANKAGITVLEYKPKENKDLSLEREIEKVSHEWLASKRSGELAFMLGGIGLADPYERRFFIAKAANGEVLGFVVFVPYAEKTAYLTDVTRRKNDAPQGVIEKLIYDGFMVFKEEGAIWGSLGLVPLANVSEENAKAKLTTKLFEYIYEHLNDVYGFKQLHHAKEKYAPTDWQARYLAYYPKMFTPQLAYAIVKVQNPKGILDYVLPILKKKNQGDQDGD